MVFFKNASRGTRLCIAWRKRIESSVKLMSKNSISSTVETRKTKESESEFSKKLTDHLAVINTDYLYQGGRVQIAISS
jgi:hypothetical protein